MSENKKSTGDKSFFAPTHIKRIIVLVLLFSLGLVIRLYDITDLPLDFHPTRQLFSALKARGMYYQQLDGVPDWQRRMAIQQWKLKVTVEPEVLERLVAFTYRFTGEQLWISRVYSSLSWLVGGIFLYLLAKSLISIDGAMIAAAFYLFLPYAVTASRSFQPDPLMVMLVLLFWWSIFHWRNRPSWGWTVLAGISGGLAIFIKLTAFFFVTGGAMGALLGSYKLKDLVRNPRVWGLIALGVLPGAIYVVYGIFVSGFLTKQFGGRFFPALLIDPLFYLGWVNTLTSMMGLLILFLGGIGLFFVRSKGSRIFILSLWGAYVVYGLFFDYHISSHDYYSLPLISIVGLSLAPLADLVIIHLRQVTINNLTARLAVKVIMLGALFVLIWNIRNDMKTTDYRPEAARWSGIGALLGHQAPVIALTEDYGSRLEYWGWQNSSIWPTYADLQYHAELRGAKQDFENMFEKQALDQAYFLVTKMDELDYQPFLKERLYTGFSIYAQGDGHIIFDLNRPLSAGQP